MLKQLKRFFGRSHQATERRQTATTTASRGGFKPAPLRSPEPGHAQPAPALATPSGYTPDLNDEDVSIPLQSVLNGLPPDLKSRVAPMDLGGATLTVTLQKILSQLPSGVVTLSFGVLRGAAPQLFTVGEEYDERDIELPLNELLVRIDPALLPKSPNKKTAANTDAVENSFIPKQVPTGPSRSVTPAPTNGPIRVPFPTTVTPAADRPATPHAPSPVAAKPAAAASTCEAIIVPLASLIAGWPAEVRAEIAQLKCANAQVVLPEQLVKVGMKQGKVAFPWQSIRAWINPAPPSVISKHDSTVLSLPLEAIMPLFISRLKQVPRTQHRLMVDETIPPLFAAAPKTEEPATERDNSSNDTNVTVDAPPAKPKTPSTDFKNRYISPAEVVTRASALNDVAGALVVLPEGLLVAARLSTNQHPDAIAAFVARALGRVNQCAEEAHVGSLSHLEFTALDIPWQIFRLHGVLFAAFGRAGGTLPNPQLAALAGEFDRKK